MNDLFGGDFPITDLDLLLASAIVLDAWRNRWPAGALHWMGVVVGVILLANSKHVLGGRSPPRTCYFVARFASRMNYIDWI